MSDTAGTDRHEKLGAHEVAAFLRRHPDFLRQFPDLAVSLVVPRDEGPAASLASYQLEVLRDKNRELNRRLHELFGNAQVNERLAVRTHQLALALMRQDDAAGTLRAMAASLAEDFQGDLVRMVVFAPVAGLGHAGLEQAGSEQAGPEQGGAEQADWLQVIPEDDRLLSPFRDCLADGEPLCGRLQPDKHALLYGARGDEVQSSALLPMPGTGLVAVGSRDANRFYPGMGTLFLRMMAETLAVALARFEAPPAR